MKKVLALLCLLCTYCFSTAQNLLPNANFTNHSCPDDFGEVARVESWYPVTQGTPDFLDSCSTIPALNVPVNLYGHQSTPHNAMLGIFTFDASGAYREYIGTDFRPLVAGVAYDVTIRVSLADSVKFASDGLGVFFYVNNKPDTNIVDWIQVTPQIDYTDYGIINDKAHWTTLVKRFVADSAYTHLVIGNFKSDADVNLSAPGSGPLSYPDIAYYYIDSVSVAISKNTAVSNATPQQDVSVAPNPFKDAATLTFNYTIGQQYSLSLFNTQGCMVLQQQNITSGHIQLHRSNLPSGFYYYQLRNESGIVATGKIMAE